LRRQPDGSDKICDVNGGKGCARLFVHPGTQEQRAAAAGCHNFFARVDKDSKKNQTIRELVAAGGLRTPTKLELQSAKDSGIHLTAILFIQRLR
jgi:hypothetical protein